jgi:methyl-accepting chemotaxis protein
MRLTRLGLGGRGPKGPDVPDVVARLGAFRVLTASPASLLITDGAGNILWRNGAALAVAAKVMSDRGEEILEQLREALRQVIREATSYPYTKAVQVTAGDYHADAEVTVAPLDDGYLATWRDITADQDNVRFMAHLAGSLAESAREFGLLLDQLASDSRQVYERTDTAAAGAEELTASFREISASTSTAVTNTRTTVEAAGAAGERIGDLTEACARIDMISKLITSIAGQTNLLALNATIEAARAGEAGRGFAVVAGEVKELALRTTEATAQIAEMIEAIQSHSAGAEAAIGEIVELVNQIEAEQTTIAGAVEEQTATAAEISQSVTTVAGVTHSSAGALTDLSRAVQVISDQATQLHALVP